MTGQKRDPRRSAGRNQFPLEELNEEIDGVPVNKKIYAFCRGRFCTLATDAVRILRSRGYETYRLKDSSNRLNYIMEAL